MLDITLGYEDSLVTLQPFGLACMVESFDLLVYSTYGLNLALLVYRASNGKVLPDWKVGESGEDRIKFGAGRAVAVNSAIALFEDKPASHTQRLVACILVFEIARDYQDSFRVYLSPELGLAFDINDSLSSESNANGYPGRLAEVEIA